MPYKSLHATILMTNDQLVVLWHHLPFLFFLDKTMKGKVRNVSMQESFAKKESE